TFSVTRRTRSSFRNERLSPRVVTGTNLRPRARLCAAAPLPRLCSLALESGCGNDLSRFVAVDVGEHRHHLRLDGIHGEPNFPVRLRNSLGKVDSVEVEHV